MLFLGSTANGGYLRNFRSFLGRFKLVRFLYGKWRTLVVSIFQGWLTLQPLAGLKVQGLLYRLLVPRSISYLALSALSHRLTDSEYVDRNITPKFGTESPPHAFFDPDHYKSKYDDLKSFQGTAYMHFLSVGKRMGYSSLSGGAKTDPAELSQTFLDKLSLTDKFIFGFLFPESNPHRKLVDLGRIDYLKSEVTSAKTAILIPFFDNWEITQDCIKALEKCWDVETKNIFVFDDGSRTSFALEAAKLGVNYWRSEQNQGYLLASNFAFDKLLKKGAYDFVFLLNNDTLPQPGFLAEALLAMRLDESIGLVGSKLIYEDGLLQEAGGIIWSDGSGWNFGRGTRGGIETEYLREVDYCSAAAVLVRVEAVNGQLFDERYVPAYCEDSDLAFRLRQDNWRVFYCPLSIVVHLEGKSHGTDEGSGIKSYQVTNQKVLAKKWAADLLRHEVPDSRMGLIAANRLEALNRPRTILWVDYQLPNPRRDAGSIRAVSVLRIARSLGFFIVYVPAWPSQISSDWVTGLGVPVADSIREAQKFLTRLGRKPDFLWVCRVTVASAYLSSLMKKFPGTPVIFDTEDLHFVREQRGAELESDRIAMALANKTKQNELAAVRLAAHTLVVSDWEKSLLEQEVPGAKVSIAAVLLPPEVEITPQRERKGLVFVGNFSHTPNLSGIRWFLDEVWPLLDPMLIKEGIDIVGQNPPEWLVLLNSPTIRVRGWVPDSKSIVMSARVSVAPILFGAGIKGKIGEAIACGTCVATTQVGAEGMGLVDGVHAIVEDDPVQMARKISDLASQVDSRERIAIVALEHSKDKFSQEKVRGTLQGVLGAST
jgi:O-antigen biosynthesis protein